MTWRTKLPGLAVLIGICVALFCLKEQKCPMKLDLPGHSASIPSLVQALRPVYPYSVIPGGAYSREELRARIEHDPLVREHYADFDVSRARLMNLDQPSYAYVSYRKDGRIYWTRHRLLLPRDELLLTDGTHWARARCGNRLSTAKKAAVLPAAVEPLSSLVLPTPSPELIRDARITLSEPVMPPVQPLPLQPNWEESLTAAVPALPAPSLAATQWSAASASAPYTPSASYPAFGELQSVASKTPTKTPVASIPSVPEPSPALLLGLGLAALVLLYLAKADGIRLRR